MIMMVMMVVEMRTVMMTVKLLCLITMEVIREDEKESMCIVNQALIQCTNLLSILKMEKEFIKI